MGGEMKVAIDVQTTVGQKVGMGSYVSNLVRWLKKIDLKNEYRLISPTSASDLNSLRRFFWDQARFPLRSLEARAEIVHQPAFSVPILFPGKKVVTIHDLIVFHFPKNIPLGSRLYFSRWMTFSYRFADAIIADSNHAKKDIVELLKFAPEKINVIPLAASETFRPIRDKTLLARIRHRYQTGDQFILHVGTLEPRKNLEFLVRVFADCVRNRPTLAHNLVIAGKAGWYFENLFELTERLGLSDRVRFTGYVRELDLPTLYSAAELFVFPSLYEGFGLPPLEAMASGTPVLVSNNSSLPEVVGRAGLLVETNNRTVWQKAVEGLLLNRSLRAKMTEAGLKQAARFSWQKTAEKTVDVYSAVARKPV